MDLAILDYGGRVEHVAFLPGNVFHSQRTVEPGVGVGTQNGVEGIHLYETSEIPPFGARVRLATHAQYGNR